MTLHILPEKLSVCKLNALSAADLSLPFFALSRTGAELSLVCRTQDVPASRSIAAEDGWRALQVEGPLPFAMTGVLAGIAQPLAQAGISIFAISTYDTDYVLLQDAQCQQAIAALQQAEYTVIA